MHTLGKTLSRSLRPVIWASNLQPVLSLGLVATTGTIAGWKIGVLWGVIACLSVVLGLVVLAAYRLQGEVDADARLVFPDCLVESRMIRAGTPPTWRKIASVTVANMPKRPTEATRVRDIRAIITYQPSGAVVEQAIDELSPNGRPVVLDLAVQKGDAGFSAYAFNPKNGDADGAIELAERAHRIEVELIGVSASGKATFELENYTRVSPSVVGPILKLRRVKN